MKSKTINIPIYQCKLTIILTDGDLTCIEKKYSLPSLEEFGAVTFKLPEKYRHYVVAFDSQDLSNIVHEIVHVKNYIYNDCNMPLNTHEDEPEAYLSGWLFDQIYSVIYS